MRHSDDARESKNLNFDNVFTILITEKAFEQIIERRMNCLFITAGGRKVRTFELVCYSVQ